MRRSPATRRSPARSSSIVLIFVFYLLLFPKDGVCWNTDPGRDILQKIGTEKEHFLQDDPVQTGVLCREWAVCWGYANIIA